MARHFHGERVPHTDRADHWRTHVEAQRLGDASQRAYCEANELAYSSFTYWRRRLTGPGRTTSLGAPVEPASAFVPVTVQPPSTTGPASATSVTVVLPGGVRIEGVHAGCVDVVTALAAAL